MLKQTQKLPKQFQNQKLVKKIINIEIINSILNKNQTVPIRSSYSEFSQFFIDFKNFSSIKSHCNPVYLSAAISV